MFKKTISTITILSILTLTACGTTEEREETKQFNSWLKTTHEPEKFQSNKYEDMTLAEPLNDGLKPTLEQIQNQLPKNRLEINFEELTKKNWFYRKCSQFIDAEKQIINEPLPEPIIGEIINPTFNGYASPEQIKKIFNDLNFTYTETLLEEHVLSGADVLPEYPIKQIIGEKTTGDYKIIIHWNNEWNIYLWEGYYEIDDPGRWNFEEYPYPTFEYAPFKILVYYLQPCSENVE
jgi:hypothetical protein